ncbi:MAG: hypothetical protein HAW66_09500 [Shewanella sp.]|nr:hypothetical protein [Shewanella sp.]
MVNAATTQAITQAITPSFSDPKTSTITVEGNELYALQLSIGVYGLDNDILRSFSHFMYDCDNIQAQVESVKSTNKLLIEKEQHYYLRIAYDKNQIDPDKNISAQIELINIKKLDEKRCGTPFDLAQTFYLPPNYNPAVDTEFKFPEINEAWVIPDEHLKRFFKNNLIQNTTEITPNALIKPTSTLHLFQQNRSSSPKPKKRTIQDRDNTLLEQETTKMSPRTRTEANRTCSKKSIEAITGDLEPKSIKRKSELTKPHPNRRANKFLVDDRSESVVQRSVPVESLPIIILNNQVVAKKIAVTKRPTITKRPVVTKRPSPLIVIRPLDASRPIVLNPVIVPKYPVMAPTNPLTINPALVTQPAVAIQTPNNQSEVSGTMIAHQQPATKKLEASGENKKNKQTLQPNTTVHTTFNRNSPPKLLQPVKTKIVNLFIDYINKDDNFLFYSESQKLMVRAHLSTLFTANLMFHEQANAEKFTLLEYLNIIKQTTDTDTVAESLQKMIIKKYQLLSNTSYQNASRRPSFERFKLNE